MNRIIQSIKETLQSFMYVIISIFVFYIIWIGGKRIYDWFQYKENDPFWQDTARILVCKKPYYSRDECSVTYVSLIDKKTAKIHWRNATIIGEDLSCYKAATMNDEAPYTFCRSWDYTGQQWDFMPLWASF